MVSLAASPHCKLRRRVNRTHLQLRNVGVGRPRQHLRDVCKIVIKTHTLVKGSYLINIVFVLSGIGAWHIAVRPLDSLLLTRRSSWWEVLMYAYCLLEMHNNDWVIVTVLQLDFRSGIKQMCQYDWTQACETVRNPSWPCTIIIWCIGPKWVEFINRSREQYTQTVGHASDLWRYINEYVVMFFSDVVKFTASLSVFVHSLCCNFEYVFIS